MHVGWLECKEEEEEEETDLVEEADLDPRKEKEDQMSPRRRPLWQNMFIMLAQPEMQVTIAVLINDIEGECVDAGDIGEALRKGVEPDWQAPQPTLEISKVNPTTGKDDAEKAKLQMELNGDKEQLLHSVETLIGPSNNVL